MKKVIAIITTFILSVSVIMAQSTPDGINYQAVARNLKGEILAKQPVSLKVSLFKVNNNQRVEYYREIQQVTTSTVGVFSVALGKGQAEFGQFVDVPWSTENIWMEISIKSKGDADFTSISSNKLLAVPYAFHSITAERLANGSGNVSNATSTTTTTNGTPSNSWLLFTNRSSNPLTDKLGTGDYTDLNIATNYTDRIRVKANGTTEFFFPVIFKDTLTAEKSVRLNTVSGNTINYGNFTVDRKSSTALTGTLKVDSSTQLQQTLRVGGVTDLMSNLNVNNLSPTFLSGTLKVDGVTDLNNNLNVNNKKSTVLTGDLRVDSDAVFKKYVKIDNSNLEQDISNGALSLPTGALQVAAGGYFGGNIVVKKSAKIGGSLSVGTLEVTSDSNSIDKSSGALTVKGGVGIGRNVNIGGAVKIDSILTVQKDVVFNSTTQSLDSANGALVVKGGVGIEKNLNVGGEMNVTTNAPYVANFKNKSGKNGISITINSSETADSKVNNGNNFVEFRNGDNKIVGRIEGETISQMENNNFNYKDGLRQYEADQAFGILDLVFCTFDYAVSALDLYASVSSSTGCVGLGACVTAPIPSLIIAAAAKVVLAAVQAYTAAVGVAIITIWKDEYKDENQRNIGVTYQSGAGDYAEYLRKADPSETFLPGDIVGIRGGKISKNVNGSEKVLVISKKPIVLGNVPSSENEKLSEKVAFLGQVPVRVFGKVNVGDYILPNGNNNGIGKAIAPSKIKSSDLKNIVGIAWSESSNETGINTINVAVGLAVNDNQILVDEMKTEINNLQNQIAQTNTMLEKLVPGFKAPNSTTNTSNTSSDPLIKINQPTNDVAAEIKALGGVVNADGSIYYKPTIEQLEAGFELAEKMSIADGSYSDNKETWTKIKNDPTFKQMIIDKITKELDQVRTLGIEEYKKSKKR